MSACGSWASVDGDGRCRRCWRPIAALVGRGLVPRPEVNLDRIRALVAQPRRRPVTAPQSPIAERVAALLTPQLQAALWHRVAAGHRKYGQLLDDNPAPTTERAVHLVQELLDGAQYAAWLDMPWLVIRLTTAANVVATIHLLTAEDVLDGAPVPPPPAARVLAELVALRRLKAEDPAEYARQADRKAALWAEAEALAGVGGDALGLRLRLPPYPQTEPDHDL